MKMKSSTVTEAPVASRTRAGVKRKKPGQGSHLIPRLDRIHGRVESLKSRAELSDPEKIEKNVLIKVALIQLRVAEARVRELQQNIERMARRLQRRMGGTA